MSNQNGWLFLFILMPIILLVSCNNPNQNPTQTSPWPISQIQKEAYGILLFWEDFEDGELNYNERWFSGSDVVEYRLKLINDQGYDNKYVLLDGPLPEFAGQEHGTGYYSSIVDSTNPFKPTYVGFDVYSWVAPGENGAYFVLQSRKLPEDPFSNRNLIRFRYRQDGNFSVNGVSYGPFDNQWHRIEFKNIIWDTSIPMFNLYIDGNLIAECIEFMEPLFEFEKVAIYNLDEVITGFDNIVMSHSPLTENGISCADEPLPTPPQPPPPQPGDPSTFIATAKQNAACRQGPANEYPEVDYVNEGFTAPVSGRNDQDTWFVVAGPNWGDDCWIWEGLLETTGDIHQVPVLPDPPLALPEDGSNSSGSEPAGPSACLVLQMNGSTRCVSPCPPQAHPGTPCTP